MIHPFWLILVALTGANAADVKSGAAAVECFRRARYGDANLGQDEAERLCARMNSLGPVQCFEKAYRDSILSREESLRLCRCATTAGPAECFIEARSKTLLDREEALNLCQSSGGYSDLSLACRQTLYGGYP